MAISADLVRPAPGWLVAKATGPGSLVHHLARTRDPDGFARLRALCETDPHVCSVAGSHTLYRAAEILAAKGGLLADVTVGDVLELLDVEIGTLATVSGDAAVFYRLVRTMGVFGSDAPATLREIRGAAGPRTPEELIDYSSMETLACTLGSRFWRDLEIHHPGIDSLRLPDEVAAAWKQRLRTKPKTISTAAGEKVTVDVPRLNHRECLIPVRAFYLDLAQWAVDDPGRWAQWAVPCPIKEQEVNRRKLRRQRKSRMDARTRERLPVLPVLARAVNENRKATGALLQAAHHAQPGQPFTAAGQTLTRSLTRHGTVAGKVWADDPAPASDATSDSKKITPSGPGRSWKSCEPPAFAWRSCWSCPTTASSSIGYPPPVRSCRCSRSCRPRLMRSGSWWSHRSWLRSSARSSTGSVIARGRSP